MVQPCPPSVDPFQGLCSLCGHSSCPRRSSLLSLIPKARCSRARWPTDAPMYCARRRVRYSPKLFLRCQSNNLSGGISRSPYRRSSSASPQIATAPGIIAAFPHFLACGVPTVTSLRNRRRRRRQAHKRQHRGWHRSVEKKRTTHSTSASMCGHRSSVAGVPLRAVCGLCRAGPLYTCSAPGSDAEIIILPCGSCDSSHT